MKLKGQWLKENVDTRTNGSKLAMNKFRLEIRRRFLILRGVRFWNSVLVGVEGSRNSVGFNREPDQFVKGIR